MNKDPINNEKKFKIKFKHTVYGTVHIEAKSEQKAINNLMYKLRHMPNGRTKIVEFKKETSLREIA